MQQASKFVIVTLLIGVLHHIIGPIIASPVLRQSLPPQLTLSQSISRSTQNLSVLEETSVGTLLADLSALLSHVLPRGHEAEGGAPAPLSITLLRGAPYVAVDPRGALIVASRIDRESPTICPSPEAVPTNTNASVCILHVSVLVQTPPLVGQNGFSRPATMSIPIVVLDIDDNSPQFPVALLNAWILENEPINSVVLRAPTARDADAAPEHRAPVEYTLVGTDAHYFTLVHNADLDTLELRTAKAIDRELLANTTLTVYILAIPKGKEQQHQPNKNLESILNVSVLVVDVNEFDSKFVGLPTEPIHVPENAETGTEVWRVVARDADADGGPIEYRFGASADATVRRAFSLESASGRVLVARAQELDYERTREFHLPIEAIDAGGNVDDTLSKFQSRRTSVTSSRTATATLHIVLDNLNDNPPSVTLSIPSSIYASSMSGSFSTLAGHTLEIIEAVPIGTFLAAITVSDPDEQNGTLIHCALNGDRKDQQIFHLEFLEIGEVLFSTYFMDTCYITY